MDALAVALICTLAFLWRLGSPGLFDFNEGLYVQAAREMVLRGDWVTGTVNGVPFYDKPPLALWCAALAFKVLGFTEFAARLPVALAAIAMTALTYALGRAALGRCAALLAATFVALNPMVLGTARQMTMDIHQSLWVTAAMAAFYAAERTRGRRQAWLAAGFWASCGLGFMAKSFPGLLPIPIVAVYAALVSRLQWREIARYMGMLRPLVGLVVLAAVIAPWHWAAFQRSGSFFVEQYWTLHHVGLLTAKEFDHAQPIWYYVPMLLVGFFPWAFLLPFADFRRSLLRPLEDTERGRLLVFVWAVVIFLAFTAMRSKLVSYLLPMYPACALLAASAVAGDVSSGRRRAMAIQWGLLGVASLVLAVFVHMRLIPEARGTTDPEALALLTPDMIRVAYLLPTVLGVAFLAAAVAGWHHTQRGAAVAAVGMAAFAFLAWEIGLPAYDRAVNAPLRSVVKEAGARFDRETPLAVHIGRPRRPSVFFYLPSYVFERPLVADRKDPILLEVWDPEPVRDLVTSRRSTYVLADHAHGSATLSGIAGARAVIRRGRWTLFHVLNPTPPRRGRPSPAGQ